MADTITEFIRQDLGRHLRAGDPPPVPLTLAALSGHYRVSLTPVRHAIDALVADGVLLKQDNGRIRVNPRSGRKSHGKASPPPSPPSDARALEAALTAEVVPLSLRGEPVCLREEATAERFGVGRTVLRQVLSRLAGKGLIEHLPRRGWRVRPFDAADMEAYLQVRESLELRALELARPHLDPADLRRMLRGNRPADGTARLDNDLHRYLIARAGNRYIADFFEHHGLFYTTLFDYAAPQARVVRAMARQHRAILRALLADDLPTARRALARHIRAQAPVLRRLLEQVVRLTAKGA